jgi:hypothetical protein
MNCSANNEDDDDDLSMLKIWYNMLVLRASNWRCEYLFSNHNTFQKHNALKNGTVFFPWVEGVTPRVNLKAHCPIVYRYPFLLALLLLSFYFCKLITESTLVILFLIYQQSFAYF